MGFLDAALMVTGTLFKGLSANAQAGYQAKVAERNAAIASENASRAAEQAQIEGLQSDREFAMLEGQQLAAQSVSGLDVLGVSQLATRATSRRARNETAINIDKQGAAQVASYANQAAGYKGDANAARSQGKGAIIGSVLSAAATGINAGWGKSLMGGVKSKRDKFK